MIQDEINPIVNEMLEENKRKAVR